LTIATYRAMGSQVVTAFFRPSDARLWLRREARALRQNSLINLIDVVDDENLRFSVMLPVQPADILSQRALPGDGHRQEERVEPVIVNALSDIARSPA
jgi:hypothetical protein